MYELKNRRYTRPGGQKIPIGDIRIASVNIDLWPQHPSCGSKPENLVQVPVLKGVKALLAAFFIGEIRPVPENIGEVRPDMKSHCHYWQFRIIVDIP
jgi:hypothetical protein